MAHLGLTSQLWRYGLVGLANTGIGLSVMFVAELVLKLPAILANAAGYGAGVAVGFALNRVIVFSSGEAVRRTGPRYVIAVALAWTLNLAAMQGLRLLLPEGDLVRMASQVAGMGVYTVSLFGMSRYWVFANGLTR